CLPRIMGGTAARVHRKVERRFRRRTKSQSSARISHTLALRLPPTTLTRISRRPNRSTAASISRWAGPSSVSAPATAIAWPPAAVMVSAVRARPRGSTSPSTIAAPSRARSWAISRPRPAAAPVTTATRSRTPAIEATRSPTLGRLQAHDLVEPAETDVERGVGGQLDDLRLREVLAQLRPEAVVDLVVIDRQLLGVAERRPLARGQQIRALVVDRGDLCLGRPRMPGPGIAQGESVATGVEAGDLDANQLAQHRIERALAHERGTEGAERLEHGGVARVGARAG